MRRLTITCLLACLGSGCSYGMNARDFSPAHAPRGVIGHFSVGAAELAGELIELRDTGVIVLTTSGVVAGATDSGAANGSRLRLLPYAAIQSARFDQTNLTIEGGRSPASRTAERLRLLSRFPQGITPELLDQLLRAYGQTRLDGVVP